LKYDFRIIYYLDPLICEKEEVKESNKSFIEALNAPTKDGYKIHSWRTEKNEEGIIAVYVLYEKH